MVGYAIQGSLKLVSYSTSIVVVLVDVFFVTIFIILAKCVSQFSISVRGLTYLGRRCSVEASLV
jgi:hypothetical protein